MSEVRNRKPHVETSIKSVNTSSSSPKVKSSAQASLRQMLLFGLLQGCLVGAVGGWGLGWVLWRNAPEELSILTSIKQPSQNCSTCVIETCPPPPCDPYPRMHQCVSRTKDDVFMKKDEDVDDFINKRLTLVYEALGEQACNVIIEDSGASKLPGGSMLSFPKEGSWAWLYERMHGFILQQNQEFWKYRLPADHRSELVEDILLMKYTNETTVDTNFFPESHWGHEIGTYGRTGKRILGALIQLNDGYEGGVFSTTIAEQPYAIPSIPRIMWIWPSFLLKNHGHVTSGEQYVLFYRVKRY